MSDIPEEIIREYNLRNKATKDGSIYIEANKGIYGLLQLKLLANKLFRKRLNKHGYRQSKLVPSLWKNDTRPIQFTLAVCNFGVKYVGKEHALHLKKASDNPILLLIRSYIATGVLQDIWVPNNWSFGH